MPVMGFTKFERFFRAAGGVDVDRDDIKRYLDFVNDALYDLLLIVALARTFKLIDAEVRAVHTVEWERAFALFRLLI